MRFSLWLAVVYGLALPVLETWRRWGTSLYWPSLADDYLIGAFLLWGAWRVRRDPSRGRAHLAAAWGLTCGMGYYSFFSHLQALHSKDPAPIPHEWLTSLLGVGWALAMAALVLTLRAGGSKTGRGPTL